MNPLEEPIRNGVVQYTPICFDQIHARYDLLNHILSFGMDIHWRQRMWKELSVFLKSGIVLDLATGTGDSAKGLIDRGYKVVGLDLSFQMLRTAVKKIHSEHFHALASSGYSLPFRDSCFDGLTCAFGIRNMHNTKEALSEIHRVLKPGGLAVFLEFSMPKGPFSIPYRLYLRHILPNIAALLSSREAYRYLSDSIERFYDRETFCNMLTECGFAHCEFYDMSHGVVTIYKGQIEK